MVSKGFPPKKKRGPVARDVNDIRHNRLTLRAHDDLMKLLSLRALEAGLSRSAYIERLLINWLRADPRNPRIDNMGKMSPSAGPTPFEARSTEPLRIAERWNRFSQAHELIFGQNAPRDWFEDADSYWPAAVGGHLDSDDSGDDPEEAEGRRLAAKKPRQRY